MDNLKMRLFFFTVFKSKQLQISFLPVIVFTLRESFLGE